MKTVLLIATFYRPRPFSSMSFEGTFISEVPFGAGCGRIGGPALILLVSASLRPKFWRWRMDPGRPSVDPGREPPREDSPDWRHRRDLQEIHLGPDAPFRLRRGLARPRSWTRVYSSPLKMRGGTFRRADDAGRGAVVGKGRERRGGQRLAQGIWCGDGGLARSRSFDVSRADFQARFCRLVRRPKTDRSFSSLSPR